MGLFTRSGIGVAFIAEALGWRADSVYQVGIGDRHEEVGVLKKAWPGVKFIGCEPRSINGKQDYDEFHQLAISNYVGKAWFNIKSGHKDGSSLYPIPKHEDCKQIEISVATLDHLFPSPGTGRILLWLDCEGSELAALQGGKQFIKSVDLVNVEHTAGVKTPDDKFQSVEIYHWLIERGFWLQNNHTHRLQEGQCDYVYCRERLFKPELCCSPQEIERWTKR